MKFEAISIDQSDRQVTYKTPTGKYIEVKQIIKDLGIQFQDNLKFSTHIAALTVKGHRMENWALHQFVSRDLQTM